MRALLTFKDLLTAIVTALPAAAAVAATKCQSHELEPANTVTRHDFAEMTLLD